MSDSCPICDGTGWRAAEDASGVRRVTRCDCWYAASKQELLKQANIPRRYEGCTLDNFVPYNRHTENALKWARGIAADFPLVDHGGLLLGNPGVGKTHLAVGILHGVLQGKSIPGLFYDFSDLLKWIRSTYDPISQFSETEILYPTVATPLLVLDNVGAEIPSAWVRETFEYVITTRYNERRATILTSNFPDRVAEGNPRESFTERVGTRLRSRLTEMCTVIEVDGIDVRPLTAEGISLSRQMLEQEYRARHRPAERPPAVAEKRVFGNY